MTDSTDTTALQAALPLPEGCLIARYAGDARELVKYDAQAQRYTVRYDWLKNGQPTGFDATPIPAADLAKVPRIEVLVSKRVQEMRAHRGLG